jgi:hypothetical protein
MKDAEERAVDPPLTQAPLEGLKRKRPILNMPLKRETTDEPSCLKTVRFTVTRAWRASLKGTRMKVNGC